jgi:hypothetical protein
MALQKTWKRSLVEGQWLLDAVKGTAPVPHWGWVINCEDGWMLLVWMKSVADGKWGYETVTTTRTLRQAKQIGRTLATASMQNI